MGEKTGFMTVLLIFAVGILPLLLTGFLEQVKSNKFLTMTNEIHQMVGSEGGVTSEVRNTVDVLEGEGIKIDFSNKNGYPVVGKVRAGEKITINYEFDGYKTKNSVTVLRR